MTSALSSNLIILTNGGESLVDPDVYEIAKHHGWHRRKEGYAARTALVADGPPLAHKIFLHHLVIGRRPGFVVDHINRNRLDNRRCNLRIVTTQQNAFNSNAHFDSQTGMKGVEYDPARKKWVARICRSSKSYMLGRYDTLAEAVAARRAAEKVLHGEYSSAAADD